MKIGESYTAEQCAQDLALDAVRHGLDIAPCLPESLPNETRAAFISFAFNVGATKACKSSAFAKARAGDLAGACAGLSAWVYANHQKLPGLVRRRAAERALCLSGLG